MLVCEIDFRVGGKWHYVLAGPPDEDDAPFSGKYLEIEPPERVVSTSPTTTCREPATKSK